ncbi:unnamed protein product [Ilex paraguariensis]|uniref:Uncharacterized protein n=1 Tax=Ilex paraguariensis TaxID=185542 RepID=A0ABC8S2Z7_9AQUA
MAFMISKHQPSFSEAAEKVSVSDQRDETEIINSVTSQLYLKSSSSSAHHTSEKALDKDVVLRRLRHHKCLNRIKNTFGALLSTTPSGGQRQKWLEQDDAFSPRDLDRLTEQQDLNSCNVSAISFKRPFKGEMNSEGHKTCQIDGL